MPTPISPRPVTSHGPDYLPAYLSNGAIGLRVKEIPLFTGAAIVSGVSGLDPEALVECAPYAPYPLQAGIQIGDVWLADAPQDARLIEQRYDFSCGELHSRFTFTVEEVQADVEVLTLCSRSLPFIMLQEIAVQFSKDTEAALCASVGMENVIGLVSLIPKLPKDDKQNIDGVLLWEPTGDFSTCGIAYSTEWLGVPDVEVSKGKREEQGPTTSKYEFKASAGTRYVLRQYAAMVPSQIHHQPELEAARIVGLGRGLGFDTLRAENREIWSELWKGRVNLLGASSRWQGMADAAFFYLHSSVHQSSPSSTYIFGLARWHNYHYYYGHVMWDIESFSIPPLLLTQPQAARAMLDYRARSLAAAHRNAQLFGYSGAQYPWQSSPAKGEECTPADGGQGAAFEQHVGLGVAHAFAQYYYASGDEAFFREKGWPVLAGVAEWIASRVTKTPRGYELRRMMGLAERKEPSDNLAYVNMAAGKVLEEAVWAAGTLGYRAPAVWSEIARGLVLPIRPNTHVIESHDGYRVDEEQGGTPEPLAGLTLMNYKVSEQVEKATLRFYLDAADRYIGTPMLSALYGAWAAQRGDRALSLRMFEEGYAAFTTDRFLNIHELTQERAPDNPPAGPFFANLGGFLMSCMFGLTGMQIGPEDPQAWCRRPVVMPEGWDGVEVERLWVRGRPARLLARHGDKEAALTYLG